MPRAAKKLRDLRSRTCRDCRGPYYASTGTHTLSRCPPCRKRYIARRDSKARNERLRLDFQEQDIALANRMRDEPISIPAALRWIEKAQRG